LLPAALSIPSWAWSIPIESTFAKATTSTREMLSQLRRGMSRDQVRYVLGSPLVVDMFRTDRWDYVYSLRSGRKEAEQRVISVFFEGDVLDRVEGDVESAQSGEGGEGAAAAAGSRSRVVEIPAVEAR
jgi:Small protein A (tmRNA-binding)